jgi:hypothetical protein
MLTNRNDRREDRPHRLWMVTLLLLAACGGGGGDNGGGGVTPPVARVPATITFEAPPTAGTVNQPVATPIAATVRTADNSAVPNVTVTFAVSAGTLTTTTVQTDGQGRAPAGSWTLGTVAGPQTITATVAGLSAQATVTAAAGAPTRLEFVTAPPARVRAGVAITPAVGVRARDQFNNIVPVAGRAISIAVPSTGGSVVGTDATTAADGTASFPALTINGLVGPRTLTVSSTGVDGGLTASLQLDPGAPSTLELRNVPGSARAGVPIEPFIAAVVSDRFGNPLTRPTVSVTATLTGTAGATLVGGRADTDSTGRALFTQLAVEGLIGTRRLQFVAEGASSTSGPVELFPGPAAELRVTQQPVRAENTLPFPNAVRVQVGDRFGNAVGGAPRQVSALLGTGGGTLQPATATTDAVGVATFPTLILTGVVGPRTLTFTSPGLTPATSGVITLDAGPAQSMTFLRSPSALATASVPFESQPRLQLIDVSGNLVRRSGQLVRATLVDPGGSLLNEQGFTDGDGVVTYDQLTYLSTPGGPSTIRLRFGSGGTASIVSGDIAVRAAPSTAVRQVIYGNPASRLLLLDPAATLALTAVARDGNGQPVTVPIVYTSSNPGAAEVRASGQIVGIGPGTAWVRAFAAGAPQFADSVHVTVTRDAQGPVVYSSLSLPIPFRTGVTTEFDIILDTRALRIGAATIVLGIPNELINSVSWIASANVVAGLDAGLNTLRFSLVSPNGATGRVAIGRVRIVSGAVQLPLLDRFLVLNPIDMVTVDLLNVTARSSGEVIPLIP